MIDVEKLKKLDASLLRGSLKVAREMRDYLFEERMTILALAEREKRMREALERIAGASVAFNANPVGVIETIREWAREGLGEQP